MTDEEVFRLERNTKVLYDGYVWKFKHVKQSCFPYVTSVKLQRGNEILHCANPKNITALPETKFVVASTDKLNNNQRR